MVDLVDRNIVSYAPIAPPRVLQEEIPLTELASQTVQHTRKAIEAILSGKDKRKIAVVGPCSIHNPAEAVVYASHLKALAGGVDDRLLVIMRTYFEKPRTTLGWPGLIPDPKLDFSYCIEEGYRSARTLLIDIASTGLGCATELLSTLTPQYIDDLICLNAVGARTVESPLHRHMASGLSMPVGYKNATNGGDSAVDAAIDAWITAREPHAFVGYSKDGLLCRVQTSGNKSGFVVLRGTGTAPNFDAVSVRLVQEKLRKRQLPERIMIDCSHGNSQKDHTQQPVVADFVIEQMKTNPAIIGFMLESNLNEGNQPFDSRPLKYGVSVTDACISLETTADVLRRAWHVLG